MTRPPDDLLNSPFFPFIGDIRCKPVEAPVIPEPPRKGEPGGAPCVRCTEPDEYVIWRDEHWVVQVGIEPFGLPMVACLSTVEHLTLRGLTPQLLTGLGRMIHRLVLAIERIEGVGRVHLSRFGDGLDHFHMWFLARPLGQMQMRGPMLAVWDQLLPPLSQDRLAANIATVVGALDEG